MAGAYTHFEKIPFNTYQPAHDNIFVIWLRRIISMFFDSIEASRLKIWRGKQGGIMDIKNEVILVLEDVLSLNGRSAAFTLNTPLLGALPELDSIAVVALIASLEERFDFVVDDDEIDGATFASLRTLVEFVQAKLSNLSNASGR